MYNALKCRLFLALEGFTNPKAGFTKSGLKRDEGISIFVLMGFIRSAIFLTVLAVSAFSALAQDPYYVSINKSGGLPSNSIYDLFQDSKGFIWIASDEGLTRYDGFEYKTYTSPAQTSLAGNEIEEDKYGRIWYKNFDGYLYYVEHDSLKSLKQNTAIGNARYAVIDDRILVLQKNGIDIFNTATLQIIKNVPFDLSELVTEMHYKDRYYISCFNILYSFSKDGSMLKYNVGTAGAMTGSKEGILMMNKENREQVCYEIVGNEVRKKIATDNFNYMHALEYCGGLYWIFTPSGAWVYDEAGKSANNGQPLFASKKVSCTLKDRDGNFWLGTLDEGILFVPNLKTKLIATPEFVPGILSFVSGVLHVCATNNAVYTYDLKDNKFECRFKGKVPHNVNCFLADTVNKNFLLSSKGFMVTDKLFHVIRYYDHAVKDVVNIDCKYCAFASTGYVGLIRLNNKITSPWDSMFSATATREYENMCRLVEAGRCKTITYNCANSAIYSGTNKGLYSITSHSVSEIKWNNETIYCRKLVSYGNNVYLLTPQSGLYVISDQNQVRKIPFANENEQFLNLKKVGGNLYLFTNNGSWIFSTSTGTFAPCDLHPGIRSDEINDLEMIGDNIIIALDRGLVLLNKTTTPSSTVPPGFVINTILVNGHKIPANRSMIFSNAEKNVDINYSILSFNPTNKCQLYYRINDGDWQANSAASRNLRLASLSPGDYNISFRLVSGHGKVFPQDTVRFVIKKPFWAEWWFLSTCLLLFTVSGYAYYKWQTRLQRKKNMLMLEKMELEKNLRNSMLTSIRAQMNPHFFYNALNTIQSFIFSDDKRNASTYLVKMSRLTRMILEMSEKEAITLDEETEALRLYLELEKMRFNSDFGFEIIIGNNVDTELIKIPSMIVQPYVENAIKHGLLHRAGEKCLTIEFIKINGNLCVTIDDNGIGRGKANELQQVKKEKHHSFSTHANNKRIELLNKERNKNIGVVYVDKANDNGEALGTTVIISIPLN